MNHNGGDRTLDCLDALASSDWPHDRLDLVLVDNASTDGVAERLERDRPDITIIRNDRNLGFGGANNRALHDRGSADYVALVNPDAFVTSGWLKPLVEVLDSDPQVGAACPKIVLTGHYGQLFVDSPSQRRGRGDQRLLGVRISGVQVNGHDVTARTRFVTGSWGTEDGGIWTDGAACLRVPVDAGERRRLAAVRLDAEVPTVATLRTASEMTEYQVGETPTWYECQLNESGATLVNNVGTDLVDDGYGADRGWLVVDDGRFDRPAEVFAWCGAGVLLRGTYLDDVGLFDERLFLYYEDVELAWRGRRRGWRYRTAPTSVVSHEHSTSTIEGSSLFDHLNERNHLLVATRHGSPALILDAWCHHMLVTGSYARRDLISPWLRGRRGDATTVLRRLRAFAAALRSVPAMLRSRVQDARRPVRVP